MEEDTNPGMEKDMRWRMMKYHVALEDVVWDGVPDIDTVDMDMAKENMSMNSTATNNMAKERMAEKGHGWQQS